MSPTILRVENLSKRYRLGQREQYLALRDVLSDLFSLKRYRRGAAGTVGEASVWALRDVGFEVRQGEILGIIGRNGAGKSTLLKILSRITKPTTGSVRMRGRVGSLLEVGTGFHPELTGRENVFLNGAILGMRRTEIARKFDEIVDFAEVEAFIDTPVKHFSTGMYLRLAFAVAAHLEAEIMLVDEVLAVGDAAFQKKCLGKMGDMAGGGRTVVFVSHNLVAVSDLCQRVLWLDGGRLAGEGAPDAVVASYLQEAAATMTERVWADPASAPGDSQARLARVCVRPRRGAAADPITVHTTLAIEFEHWQWDPRVYVHPTFYLYNEQGILICSAGPALVPDWRERSFPTGLIRSRCLIPGDLLNDGGHRLAVHVVKNGQTLLRDDHALSFDVHDAADQRGGWYGKWHGVVRPAFAWEAEVIAPAAPAVPATGMSVNGHGLSVGKR